jgi:integrase/recombinase XerD
VVCAVANYWPQPVHIDSLRILVLPKTLRQKIEIVPLSTKILNAAWLLIVYKPKTYLFEGQTIGLQYDARGLQLVKQALQKNGIKKTCHYTGSDTVTQLIY